MLGLAIALPSLVLAAIGVAGLADFDLAGHDTRELTVDVGGHAISGTLILPKGVASPPIAVIVHGDGASRRFLNDGLLPMINALADAGIGSFAYDKPGVGASTGDWLALSMSDRASEALAVLDAIRGQPGIDPDKVGFLGFSQAGWALPEAATRGDPAFTVIVGAAVNWRRQGTYHNRIRLEREGLADDRIAQALADRLERNDRLFENGAKSAPPPGSDWENNAARFGFVARAYHADASADIATMRGPVLAIWGARDVNVDPLFNSDAWRDALGPTSPARHVAVVPGATHGLLRAALFDYQRIDGWPATSRAAYALLGRRAFAPGALALITGWIDTQTTP